jgi:probable rRNA maturation factor
MPLEVCIEGDIQANVALLRRQAESAMRTFQVADAELSLVLCDDAFIQPLNLEWRGKAEPTDVLSFPMADPHPPGAPPPPPPGLPHLLGDLVVSVQTARRQADALGHDLETELAVLLVHGLAHLLGWTHETESDAAAMVAAETRALTAIGATAGSGLVERVLGAS